MQYISDLPIHVSTAQPSSSALPTLEDILLRVAEEGDPGRELTAPGMTIMQG